MYSFLFKRIRIDYRVRLVFNIREIYWALYEHKLINREQLDKMLEHLYDAYELSIKE